MSAKSSGRGDTLDTRDICAACGREIIRTFIHPRVWVFGHAKGCTAVATGSGSPPSEEQAS